MRQLIVMRHAKSDWKRPELSDHDRPLNKRGRLAAPLMARHLRQQGLSVDVILASSAVRVQETLELVRTQWAADAEVLTERSLYLASPQEIGRQIQSLHDSWQSALVIGHNPGIAAFASCLAEKDCEMPTAAVAVFAAEAEHWSGSLAQGTWHLAHYWIPRELE